MAISNGYCTLDEIKSRHGIELAGADTLDDTALELAIEAASREIDRWCRRRFWRDGSTSARLYLPDTVLDGVIWIDDYDPATAITVKSDDDDDGTFETTWVAGTDYQAEPLNPDVYETGAKWMLRLLGTRSLRSVWSGRPQLQVTAKWGWPAVPAAVKQACMILAFDLFKSKDAPFGVAGTNDFGVLRIRDNPQAKALLAPYRHPGGVA